MTNALVSFSTVCMRRKVRGATNGIFVPPSRVFPRCFPKQCRVLVSWTPRPEFLLAAKSFDVPRMNRQTRACTDIQDAHAIVRLRPESPLFRGGFFFRERSIQASTLCFPCVPFPQSMSLLLLDRDVYNSRRRGDVDIVGDMFSKAASWEI